MMEIAFPSEEEIREGCQRRYDAIRDTLLDHWPWQWHLVSIPTQMFELSPDEASLIVSLQDGGDPADLTPLADRLDEKLDWRNHFIRLNTRSPKDVTDPALPITCAGRQIVSWLASSARTFEDLCLLLRVERPAFIALREPTYIAPEGEFRCFVKDGEFVTISQYFYDQHFDYLQDPDTRNAIKVRIGDFWRAKLQPFTDMTNYVFDVFIAGDCPELIEVNPYGLSDPCAAKSYEAVEQGGFFFIPKPHGKGRE